MTAVDTLPLVSLILTTYNRPALLRLALQSVWAQTYPRLQIIVVDDGSTDETATWLTSWGDRIHLIRQANTGLSVARNRGIAAATGTFLTFLDDDDLIAPTKIARQVAFLQQHPEIDIVHCGYYRSNEAGPWQDKVDSFPQGDTSQHLRMGNFIWSGGPLLRRECLEKVGLFDESLLTCEDWDMWLRLAQTGCGFAALTTPLGMYRQLPDGMSGNWSRMEEGVMRVLDKTWGKLPKLAANAATKGQAYGQMWLWLAARAYASGQWPAGQRYLAQAINWQPSWQQQPALLLPLLRGHALDIRITQPPQFITHLFDHLPDEAECLRPHQPWLSAYAQLGLALRHQASGNDTAAQAGLATALQTYPALTHHLDDLTSFLTQYALSLPVEEPVQFAAAVLSQLSITSPSILGDVALGWAFQAYYAGEMRFVPRRVLMAWRYRPTLLKNRGSWAIFLKSFRRQGRQGWSYVI